MSAKLREGFTTGTAAAAAAKAALGALLGLVAGDVVDTPLPGGGRLSIPLRSVEILGSAKARATVIKDAGDDPDATHGALIVSVARIIPGDPGVEVSGGFGVGRVTKPGLPVAVGEAAINPCPRKQICCAALESIDEAGFTGRARIIVEVPQGPELALKTMNPRLGIVGGISILGTGGIVRPYSHEAWKASISQAMDVARASGHGEIVLTTGRRSERLYLELFPATSPGMVVQAADFFAYSMAEAAKKGFSRVVWSLFFGKLVKQAMGFEYTHAKDNAIDFQLLASWCREVGLGSAMDFAHEANTASQVWEAVKNEPARHDLLELLVSEARAHARKFAGAQLDIHYQPFDISTQKPL